MSITVEPQGEVALVKCPLEEDYKNTLTFTNGTQQFTYFSTLPNKLGVSSADYTFIRKDNKIRVQVTYEKIASYNYLYYVNKGFNVDNTQNPPVDNSKRYYCFIDKIEYVNENCSDIYFHTDVFQTWYFQIVWNRCFVEREHVNDDTIGLHTVPEGLETGEFITNSNPVYINHYSKNGNSVAGNDSYAIVCATNFPEAPSSNIVDKYINGIFNGCVYIVATGSTASAVSQALDTILKKFASEGTLDYVQCVFMIPKQLLIWNEADSSVTTKTTLVTVPANPTKPSSTAGAYYVVTPDVKSFEPTTPVTITINSTINGYTPKNNKLFTREFNNFILSNMNGTDVEMAYEDFTNHTPVFKCVWSITPGCSVKCVPLNYRLLADSINNGVYTSKKSYNYGISGAKYPICAWSGDVFTNWLTQNGINLALGGIGGAASMGIAAAGIAGAIGSGGLTVGLAAMAAGGAGAIGSQLGAIYKHHITPEQTKGNISSGDVTYSDGKSLFVVFPTCIRAEYAHIIDDYFSAFGYKINRVKVPNRTGRRYWNFIKTIDCNCDGDIPQEDLKEIRKACNHGITFWHDPSKIYDYSQTNSIVT